jgi:peptidoglycan/LPS O-acetylase OafA/YrhL
MSVRMWPHSEGKTGTRGARTLSSKRGHFADVRVAPHARRRTRRVVLPAPSDSADESSSPGSVGTYYPWLDALRGLSWIMVMIGHTTPLGYVARVGVGIFFAISGWLITKIILRQTESSSSLTDFYTRRCLRIIPLYYVLILVASGVSFCFPFWSTFFAWLPASRPESEMWPYLFTFSTEAWRGGGGGFLISHCWSLCVEERFYVFWPLLLTLWPRHINARRMLIVIMILWWFTRVHCLSMANVTIALWAMPFPLLVGCALAIFVPKMRGMVPKYVTLPLGLLALGLYIVHAADGEIRLGPTINIFSLPAGLLAAGLVVCAVTTAGAPRNWLLRLLQEAGKLSYAAYLFHVIFALLAIKMAAALGYFWLGPIIGVAMCAPFAYAVHRWIEQPILNMRHTVAGSAHGRIACTCLQVVPTCLGLMLIFPWGDVIPAVYRLPGLGRLFDALASGVVAACVCGLGN